MAMDVVVQWFGTDHRKLPWREETCTPWGVLVSEVMLQQTPVARVLPVWQEWIARWPTPNSCARAPLSEVITLWGRLGYPRRAKRLHEAASVLATTHEDSVPEQLDALLALPGVGDYTARAVRCFAFGVPDPVVDTNVRRVLARLVEGHGEAGPPRAKADLDAGQAALDRVTSVADKVTLSKGLMELGAMICTARSPRCETCPVASRCEWRSRGYPVYEGPKALSQKKFEGSDRQMRGVILRELRASDTPVPTVFLATLTEDRSQLDRAVASLCADGLIQESPENSGHLHLAD
jgi:A/G-specific adenine glycosylase